MPRLFQVIDGTRREIRVPTEAQARIMLRSGWRPVTEAAHAPIADPTVDEPRPDEGTPDPSTEEE